MFLFAAKFLMIFFAVYLLVDRICRSFEKCSVTKSAGDCISNVINNEQKQ